METTTAPHLTDKELSKNIKAQYELKLSNALSIKELEAIDTAAVNDGRLSIKDYLSLDSAYDSRKQLLENNALLIKRTHCTTFGVGTPENITITVNMGVLIEVLEKKEKNLSYKVLQALGINYDR